MLYIILILFLLFVFYITNSSSKIIPIEGTQDLYNEWPECRLWNYTFEAVNQAWVYVRNEQGEIIGKTQQNIDPSYRCAKCPEDIDIYECTTYCSDPMGAISLTQYGAEMFTIVALEYAEQLVKTITFPEMVIPLGGIAEIKIKDLGIDRFKVEKVSFRFTNDGSAESKSLPTGSIDKASLSLSGEFSLKVPFLQVLASGRLDISISDLNGKVSVGIYINNNAELEWDTNVDHNSCPYHISFGVASSNIILGNLAASLTGEGLGALNMIIQSLLSSLKDMLNKILGSALLSSIFAVVSNALNDDTIAKPHKVPSPHNHVMYDQRFTSVTFTEHNVLIPYSGIIFDNGYYGSHLKTMYRSRKHEHNYENSKDHSKNIILYTNPTPADISYCWHYEILNTMFHTFFSKGIHEYDGPNEEGEIFSYSADIIYRKSMLDLYEELREEDVNEIFTAKYILNQGLNLPTQFSSISDDSKIKYHLEASKPPVVDKMGANGILVVAEKSYLNISAILDDNSDEYTDIAGIDVDLRFVLIPGYTLERWDTENLTNMNATMVWFDHRYFSAENFKINSSFGSGAEASIKDANIIRKVIKSLMTKIVGPKLYRMSRCDKFSSIRLENIPMIKTYPESDVTKETINAGKLKFCAKDNKDVWTKDYIPDTRIDEVTFGFRSPLFIIECNIGKGVKAPDKDEIIKSKLAQNIIKTIEKQIKQTVHDKGYDSKDF